MVPAGDRPGSSERYSFAFDRVFGPSASQVCWFIQKLNIQQIRTLE